MKFEAISKITLNIAVTFIQGAFAAWAVSGFAVDKLALGAAVGAGLSAVWNLLVKPFLTAQGYISASR